MGDNILNRNEKINRISLTGKQKCEMLRTIRKEIAQRNGIEYLSADCTHEGDCLGTCPKCDAEVRFLEYELNQKAQKGESISIIGINEDIVKMIEQIEDSITINDDSNDNNDTSEEFLGTGMEEEPFDEIDEDEDIDDINYSENESYIHKDREAMGMSRLYPFDNKKNPPNVDVRDIGLSIPVCHWLISSKINTLSKLCSMTEKDILDKTMVGTNGIKEIKDKLNMVGLSLKGEL